MSFGLIETLVILVLAIGAVVAFVNLRSLERKAREDRLDHPW